MKLKMNFSKKNKYEIRRAERENIQVGIENDIELFRQEYNRSAKELNITLLSAEHLNAIKNNLYITKGYVSEKIIIYHAYLVDEKRARLLYSARVEHDEISNSFYGFTNRKLHYEDMVLFKKLGFEIYDFGGISKKKNKKLENINDFKESFSGEEVQENNYYNISMWLLLLLNSFLKKLKEY